jgi:hypothetical protein
MAFVIAAVWSERLAYAQVPLPSAAIAIQSLVCATTSATAVKIKKTVAKHAAAQ